MDEKKIPVGLIIIGLVVFILVFVNLRAVNKWRTKSNESSSSVKVAAEVLKKEHVKDKYHIKYIFETYDKDANLKSYAKTIEVNRETYESSSQGGTVYVYFKPDNPRQSNITTNTQSNKGLLWVLLIDAIALFSIIYLVNTSQKENLIK